MKYSCPKCDCDRVLETTLGVVETETYSFSAEDDSWTSHDTDTSYENEVTRYSCPSCGYPYTAQTLDKVLREMSLSREALLCKHCQTDLVETGIGIYYTSTYNGYLDAFFVEDVYDPYLSVVNELDSGTEITEHHVIGNYFCKKCNGVLPPATVEVYQRLKEQMYNHEDIMKED